MRLRTRLPSGRSDVLEARDVGGILSENRRAPNAKTPAMWLPELAASIRNSGVLQNLVVVQATRAL
jgi:hypothetical protein